MFLLLARCLGATDSPVVITLSCRVFVSVHLFDSVWGERSCAEICRPLPHPEKLRKVAQPCWCLNKKEWLCVWCFLLLLDLSTWIVFLHPVCKKKFHLWLLWLFRLFASFFILWLHILTMELCQILSPYPKSVISSAFSPLSFLAAGSSQNSSKPVSRRLVLPGPRAELRKQNKAVIYFNQAVLLQKSSFSLILYLFTSDMLQYFTAFLLCAEAWHVLPLHIK